MKTGNIHYLAFFLAHTSANRTKFYCLYVLVIAIYLYKLKEQHCYGICIFCVLLSWHVQLCFSEFFAISNCFMLGGRRLRDQWKKLKRWYVIAGECPSLQGCFELLLVRGNFCHGFLFILKSTFMLPCIYWSVLTH